ncbi:MAG TPA: cell wall-binding repeat-containing protein, partial [Nitriliruptorales bacterium]|nr:cell wall-binding repeat-containing protein [Nitriliruptorales bacterium]
MSTGPGLEEGPPVEHRRPRLTTLPVAWVLGLVCVTLLAGGAAAVPVSVDPSVIQPQPRPGDVVAAGPVTVGAILWASAGVSSVEVRVDGSVVGHQLETAGAQRHVRAPVRLGAGHHAVEIRMVDARGRTAARQWWVGVSDLAVERLAGADRVATATAVSRRHYPARSSAPAVVLARSDDFPDALGGAPLAAELGGPLLLTHRDGLTSTTRDELIRVLAPGGAVHLLGGSAALSGEVERQVGALGFEVRRHAGPDRYATAVAVAALIPETTTAVVVSGTNFPDALAASSPAARDGLPILLTAGDRITPPVRGLLSERAFDTVHVVGGTAVVPDDVLRDVDAVAGTVSRIAGPTRYETAVAVAARLFPRFDTVVVASGERFPDALTGGPYAAARAAPLLLTPPRRLPAVDAELIVQRRPSGAVLLGGPATLDPSIEAELRRAHVGSPGGPREVELDPAPDHDLSRLRDLHIRFDRALRPPGWSSVYVTLDGLEVEGRVEHASDPAVLVFRPIAPPIPLEPGQVHDLRVLVAAFDGTAWRHFEYSLRLHGPVRSAPGLVRTLADDGASGVAPGERAVALTFDDGPSPAYTPQILAMLDRFGVSGTFFVTGTEAERFAALTSEVARRGHVVTNHTMHHRQLTGLPETAFSSEVDATTHLIQRITGQPVYCVRPPYGAYDGEVVARLTGRGLHTAMWTVDPRDWTRPGSDEIVRRTLAGLSPGAIVVLHDGGGDRSQTVAALPRILEGIRAAGYRVVAAC